ncbi:hypothetical protein [Kamptonema sp. UHCC 0994]|uniref:hypothetical protein n=1 Tax=Kamptonema sp. UHCC 0994 TaxID=3031329 RepID=UPI0023BA721D|nr:hypothetical protein [Kamptonema sp. UHCC 0994]MDF0556152.1 hypothetical protein [Kamptonema sp. UHCC 0994]
MLGKTLKSLKLNATRLYLAGFLTLILIISADWFASIQATSKQPISPNCNPIVPDKLYRYIATLDSCLTPMSDREIQKQLNDPFAIALLRQGIFPANAEAISQAIADSNLGYSQTSYVVGEGFQIPLTTASREAPRSLRYVVTWGVDENDAQIMLGTLAPASQSSVNDIISWDTKANKYNFYALRHQVEDPTSPQAWSWAGDSTLAPQPPTMKKNCFNCHHNGLPIMKELEIPWNNWHSDRAAIASTIVPTAVANESFFQQRRGAKIFESVIRANFQNYYSHWLETRIRKQNDTIEISDVDRMLRHLTVNTTINLKSSNVQSDKENTSPGENHRDLEKLNFSANKTRVSDVSLETPNLVPEVDVTGVPPTDTFLSDTIFQSFLGLDYSSLSVTFSREDYDAYLKDKNFALVGTKSSKREDIPLYRYAGSTYFAYFVPQISAEDIYITRLLLNSQILTDKFVASILMVDYKNPLFSEKRARLQKYAQKIPKAKIVNGVSNIPGNFAAKIKAVAKACKAENFDTCSAEEQFLYTWELPDNQWQQLTSVRLQAYVDSFANLEPDKQLDRLMRLSIEQSDRFASTLPFCKLFEFKSLIPETDFSQLSPCQTTADRP